MTIQYVNSEEVHTSSQLNEIFRDKCDSDYQAVVENEFESMMKL